MCFRPNKVDIIRKIFNTMFFNPPKKVKDQNLVSSAHIGKLGKYLDAILH